MISRSSDTCPACGMPMLTSAAFTGVHETGSTACRAAVVVRQLVEDDLVVVRDMDEIQRLLEFGAEPRYVFDPREAGAWRGPSVRVFVTERWRAIVLKVIERGSLPYAPALIVAEVEKRDELRRAIVAAHDLSTGPKDQYSAVRRLLDAVVPKDDR